MLAERADLTKNGLWNVENDRSGGRDATIEAIAGALKVARAALDDDAECFRELARICGVELPSAGPSIEGEAARIFAAVPDTQRPGLLNVLRGLAPLFIAAGKGGST